jgi:hypothetical protein
VDPREVTKKKDDHGENALRYLMVEFGGPTFVEPSAGQSASYEPADEKTGY